MSKPQVEVTDVKLPLNIHLALYGAGNVRSLTLRPLSDEPVLIKLGERIEFEIVGIERISVEGVKS